MDVAGIVRAAGSSRRLGRPKQTLACGGRTLLEHVVADVEASVLERVVVVLGSDATAVMLQRGRAELTYAESEGGCAASLQAGLDAAGGARRSWCCSAIRPRPRASSPVVAQ
jgi:molybdenum cofactor cytidylyltransferase